MNILIVDKESGFTFQFTSTSFPSLLDLRERIALALYHRRIKVKCSDYDTLIERVDRVQLGNYKEGSGHCDRFDVYAILL